MFRFFSCLEEAEKFAISKECTNEQVEKFKNQFYILNDIINGLSELRDYYRFNNSPKKADTVASAAYVLAQVNGITRKFVEGYNCSRIDKIDRVLNIKGK